MRRTRACIVSHRFFDNVRKGKFVRGPMNKVDKRHARILSIVDEQGFASTEQLVEALDVTPQTIRRDINLLCERNMLQRFHGGAGRRVTTENESYSVRSRTHQEGKRRIAEAVAEQVHDGASMFINIGTTTEAVAEALLGKSRLRVVTNNINVAQILSRNETYDIQIAGGIVRNRDGGVVGPTATEFVSRFRLDYGVIGVSGIEPDGALLDFDAREVETAQAIIRNSDRVILVADQTKFGRRAMVRYGDLKEVHALFTDAAPPAVFANAIAQSGVKLHIAHPND